MSQETDKVCQQLGSVQLAEDSMEESDTPQRSATKRRKSDTNDFEDEELEYLVIKYFGKKLPPDVQNRLDRDEELKQRVLRMGPRGVLEAMGMEYPDRPPSSGWSDPNIQPSVQGNSSLEDLDSLHEHVGPQYMTVPQTEPIDKIQVKNSAGGYVFKVDDMMRLKRLLVLGHETGSYYLSRKELAKENARSVQSLIEAKRGQDIVQILKAYAGTGDRGRRVMKLDSLLFVLAMCASQNDHLSTKRDAYKALLDICTIPTDLFMFLEYYDALHKVKKKETLPSPLKSSDPKQPDSPMETDVEPSKAPQSSDPKQLDGQIAGPSKAPKAGAGRSKAPKALRHSMKNAGRGWGRAHRMGVSNWYLNFKLADDKNKKKRPRYLAFLVTKYKNRKNWKHMDVMRMAHPKPNSDRGSAALAAVIKFIVKGLEETKREYGTSDDSAVKEILEYLEATEELRVLKASDEERAIELVTRYQLAWEHLPTDLHNSRKVRKEMMPYMPINTLVRQLGKMTCTDSLGLLAEDGGDKDSVDTTLKKLSNKKLLENKMHPFKMLVALTQYRTGHGDKGKLTWTPNKAILKALEDGFYTSFKTVESTNKRICIALDISASMEGYKIAGTQISARKAAAAMAMVTVRTEDKHEVVGFHNQLIDLEITPELSLEEVESKTSRHGFGSTDCAKPMIWARDYRKLFDVFIIYTDSETYSGSIHATQALRQYREASRIHDAKLIVVAMCSNGFTIADPEDANMLDIVGFDGDAPEIMRQFISGEMFTSTV